ncbi:MAG TPA: hypothetical protein VGG39_23100 [Polyangiaceae bacterium]|jgi:hypothetical protein
MPRRWSLPAALASLALGGLACSRAQTGSTGPSSSQYEIVFPSTEAAIATQQVEVLVFDTSMEGADCLSLLITRQAGAPLPESPTLLLDTGAIGTCSLAGGGGSLDVAYGPRSFLVVAESGGEDLFTGCAQADVEPNTPPIVVPIAQAATPTALPTTSCTSLSQKCDGGC